ncbi:AT-rich interactive domain-containing protein 5 [Ancistrocladus abbreviatus]
MSNSEMDVEDSGKLGQEEVDDGHQIQRLDAKVAEDDLPSSEDQSLGSPNENENENDQSTANTSDAKGLQLHEEETPLSRHKSPKSGSSDDKSENGATTGGVNQIESEAFTPRSTAKSFSRTAQDVGVGVANNGVKKLKMIEDEETGTKEEQAKFMNEVESFYRERSMDFKPPKFYGEPLNCLKLWRAVIRLGGYDRVTASKLWRQVGESFHPPKTCTTVSWTFRIFYEKALLEYEKHKRQIGELEFPGAPLSEPISVENEGSGYQNTGSGRARRDAAARAMQGWHVQRLIGFGEVGEPIIKDKNLATAQKREKHIKSIASGVTKQKKPSNLELAENDMHTESNKQLLATVVDVGPPADWVKINVRESKDCFEVYALVPGLLREEVRVQSDPAGRLVITGQPEQLDNPWGITPFRKIVNLPARINPLQTSAVVSLHGRLFVRVPFERSSS